MTRKSRLGENAKLYRVCTSFLSHSILTCSRKIYIPSISSLHFLRCKIIEFQLFPFTSITLNFCGNADTTKMTMMMMIIRNEHGENFKTTWDLFKSTLFMLSRVTIVTELPSSFSLPYVIISLVRNHFLLRKGHYCNTFTDGGPFWQKRLFEM